MNLKSAKVRAEAREMADVIQSIKSLDDLVDSNGKVVGKESRNLFVMVAGGMLEIYGWYSYINAKTKEKIFVEVEL